MARVWVLLACAAVCGCDSESAPPPPDAVVCPDVAPSAIPPISTPKPNIAGTTTWYAFKSMRFARHDAAAWESYSFDLDGVNSCVVSASNCVLANKKLVDRPSGVDNAFAEGMAYTIALGCTYSEELRGDYTLLLRIEDLGFGGEDGSAPGAIYVARALEKGEMPTWTVSDRWIVDAASLEDGTSIDRPRIRFPRGFVKDGRWWSGVIDRQTIDVRLSVGCSALHPFLPIRPEALTLAIDAGKGTLAGVVAREDAIAALDVIGRRIADCAYAHEQTETLDRSLDLLANDPKSKSDRPCDGMSVGLGFDAAPTSPPAEARTFSVDVLRAEDVCSPSPRVSAGSAAKYSSETTAPGPTYGLTPEGRVAITAAEAWPGRASEPPLLAAPELARACVTVAACLYLDDLISFSLFPESVDESRRSFAQICANPPHGSRGSFIFEEQHAIPLPGIQERLPFLLSAALDAKGDCSKVRAARTKAPDALRCESHGCFWRSDTDPLPTVTCAGTVATLVSNGRVYTRDCSRAFVTCDPKSPTGCADRPLRRCDEKGTDRCDGNIHLGCRSSGFVSYRDCARYGGTCEQIGDGADCTYLYPECPAPKCDGTKIQMCALGETFDLDCRELGFSGCTEGRCH